MRGASGMAVRARPSRRERGEVRLGWALDRDGGRVCARDLDGASRRARAPFRCIGCGEPLVPHLGRIRAAHFAHLPGSRCPLAAPESALHLDAKERLVALCEDAFAGRRRVTVEARCPACRRAVPIDLAGIGDSAVREGAVANVRADVLVTRLGRPALAFEVCVTHAVGDDKERTLAGAAVPAAEIDAWSEWERSGPDGTAVACARTFGIAPCGPCQAAARAEAGRALGGEEAARAELESYRARGLFGPPPGPAAEAPPLGPAEHSALAAEFRCPDCASRSLEIGARLARHACPGASPRAVAWRGYDGALVMLRWWRRA